MKIKFDWFMTGMVLVTGLAWLFPAPGATGGWKHPEELTKAGVPWEWTAWHQECLVKLQDMLLARPVQFRAWAARRQASTQSFT